MRPALLVVLAACGSSSLDVTLVDATGGWPLADARWIATSDRLVGCPALEASSDADGRARFPGACGDAAYTITDPTGTRDASAVVRAGAHVQVALRLTPPEPGVWRLHPSGLEQILATSEARSEPRSGPSGAIDVYYPRTLPPRVPRLLPGEALILSGPVRFAPLAPLIAGDEWWFLGGTAGPGGAFDPVEPPGASVGEASASARWIPASALTYGRYGLRIGDRIAVLDVGPESVHTPATETPTAPPVEEPGTEPAPEASEATLGLPDRAPNDH
jgi:hypothetical protein